MATDLQPLTQEQFNVVLDSLVEKTSPHHDSWGFLRAIVNPEFNDPVMIENYRRHVRECGKKNSYLIVVDLQTPEPINKNPGWLMNQLGRQTEVSPARKNYTYHDLMMGFASTELLFLYNLDTLTTKKGTPHDQSLELLLSLFRNDHLARVLIPDTEPTWAVIGHHRLASAFMQVDLAEGYWV